jgi:hypothetical protein
MLDYPTGGADPSAQLVYPNDQTIFPLGVLGPEMQWNGASATDAYKLEIKEHYYHYVEYFTNVALPSRHLLTDANWSAISLSGGGPTSDPIAVAFTRATATTAYTPLTQTWHVSQDSLHGLLYYWQLPSGATPGDPNCCGVGGIVRLKMGDSKPESFIDIPTSWAPGNASEPSHCWGCHNVSRDGTKMVADFQNASTLTVGTLGLSPDGGTLGSVVPNDPNTGGVEAAFDNTGNYIIFSAEGNTATGHQDALTGGINLMDSKTGAILKQNVMPAGCSEPAWSPDGKHASASCKLGGQNCADGWFFSCSVGDVSIAATSGTTFGPTSTIVPSNGARKGQPDFSPDSQWLVYTSLAANDYFLYGQDASAGGELHITNLTGTSDVDLATAGGTPNRSARAKYAPLRSGGYSWIVFVSTRAYGNELPTPGRPQLWIAAIDDPPNGQDPSHPAFYVRGQDMSWQNMQAEFALPPCKPNGDSCSTGSDCCNHTCVDANGTLVCGPPNGCATNGNGCSQASDCCDPKAICEDGYCQSIIP